MLLPVGDLTVGIADDDALELIAAVTGLSRQTVRRRWREAHGNMLLRNLFRRHWPDGPERLASLTVKQAHDADLSREIASSTGLSEKVVRRRLEETHGRTLVVNAFPEMIEEDCEDEYDDDEEVDDLALDEEEDIDGGDDAEAQTSLDAPEIELLGAVRVVSARSASMTIWLARQLGWRERRLRRLLREKHGRMLLRNALNGHWPVEVGAGSFGMLGEMRLAAIRRSPSLIVWVARILGVHPQEIMEELFALDGNVMLRNAFSGWPSPDAPAAAAESESRREPTMEDIGSASTVRDSTPAGERALPPISHGTLIKSRWRLGQPIGERGSFSKVFDVTDQEHPDRDYVIKVADGSSQAERQRNEELLRSEVAIAHRLDHQHICSYVVDGLDTELGVYFAVMKHAGRSLESLIRSATHFTVEEAVEIVEQVAEGLDWAHDYRGVIHQDLKPANILVQKIGRRREVRIGDWGIARHGRSTQRSDGSPTVIATVVGHSPGYTAPEQFRGEARSASDQYCLALVFCSLLLGQVFTRYYRFEGLRLLTAEQNAVIKRALSHEPEDRFSTCEQFVAKLKEAR